jgi:hypothetical protein
MSYSVCAYLTEADKVKSVYGARDNQLINQLKVALKQELDSLNDYFSDSLNTDKDAYAVLADIVNGEVRYPEIASMYGYVYEKICNHFGTQIYCAENLWQLDSQSTFIPIPLSSAIFVVYIDNVSAAKILLWCVFFSYHHNQSRSTRSQFATL